MDINKIMSKINNIKYTKIFTFTATFIFFVSQQYLFASSHLSIDNIALTSLYEKYDEYFEKPNNKIYSYYEDKYQSLYFDLENLNRNIMNTFKFESEINPKYTLSIYNHAASKLSYLGTDNYKENIVALNEILYQRLSYIIGNDSFEKFINIENRMLLSEEESPSNKSDILIEEDLIEEEMNITELYENLTAELEIDTKSETNEVPEVPEVLEIEDTLELADISLLETDMINFDDNIMDLDRLQVEAAAAAELAEMAISEAEAEADVAAAATARAEAVAEVAIAAKAKARAVAKVVEAAKVALIAEAEAAAAIEFELLAEAEVAEALKVVAESEAEAVAAARILAKVKVEANTAAKVVVAARAKAKLTSKAVRIAAAEVASAAVADVVLAAEAVAVAAVASEAAAKVVVAAVAKAAAESEMVSAATIEVKVAAGVVAKAKENVKVKSTIASKATITAAAKVKAAAKATAKAEAIFLGDDLGDDLGYDLDSTQKINDLSKDGGQLIYYSGGSITLGY